MERARQGERLVVTRAGEPVAELTGLRRRAAPLAVILEHWRRLPHVDADRLRADVDAVLDAAV